MHAFGGRQLAHPVDDATGVAHAEQARRRAAHHFDALQRVGFAAEEAVAVAQLLEAVAVVAGGLGVEAADVQPVVALRIGAVGLHPHTGHVAQRLADGLRVLRVQLLAGDHRDRLRNLDQRGAGLGAAAAGARHVADVRRIAGAAGVAVDGGRVEGQRGVAGQRFEHVAVGAGAGAQAAALQQAGEACVDAVAAAQPRRAQAAHLAGIEGDGHAGLAGIAVQRLAERAGGDVELADLAVRLGRHGGQAETGGEAELQGEGEGRKAANWLAHGGSCFVGLCLSGRAGNENWNRMRKFFIRWRADGPASARG
ncbi:hypothetical protein D9M70_353790 [compost metagenome]